MLYFYQKTYHNIDFEEFKKQYYFLNVSRQTRLLGRWIKLAKTLDQNEYLGYIDVTINRLKKSLLKLNSQRFLNLYKKIL